MADASVVVARRLEGKPIAATLAPGNSLIAATALAYGFIVVTRNAHDISMSA